ncbi:reverse transcriptase domain-containing protein [Photobacterium damselae]|uniref:reverse transcriptase domain-containing protein n=1 Tax=Photobacterium damselae TaxID=38293 RepID=UPI004067F368
MTKLFTQNTNLKYHHQLTAELLQCVKISGSSQQKSANSLAFSSLCSELSNEILTNTYQPHKYHHFAITEPKIREIYAPAFRDRIAQMWVALQLVPIMELLFIDDTYANRKGKGTLAAISKAQKLMRQPRHTWGLQIDIYSYFNSINKRELLAQLLDLISQSTLSPLRKQCLATLVEKIILHDATQQQNERTGNQYLLNQIPSHKKLKFNDTGNFGLPIGSVTSQLFGNFYLNKFDHEIKHSLRVKGYVRYMDDILLLADSPETLMRWKTHIECYLASHLHLRLHPTKVHLSHVNDGFNYLGFHVFPHYKHIRNTTITSLKDRLRYFNTLFGSNSKGSTMKNKPTRGIWSKHAIYHATFPSQLKAMQSTINSYFGLLSQANHCKLRQQIYHNEFGELKRYLLPNNAYYNHFTIKKGLHFDKTAPNALCWPETHEA